MRMICNKAGLTYWVDTDNNDTVLSPYFEDEEDAIQWYGRVAEIMFEEFNVNKPGIEDAIDRCRNNFGVKKMNQRFNAHDLWTRVCQEEMPELDESCMTMQRTRKFAELIVRQCMDLVKDCYAEPGRSLYQSVCASTIIEEHFGLKNKRRIRDLQIQAFAECKTFEDDKVRTDEVFERFAELIVRQCGRIARDTELEDVEGGDSEVLRAAKRQILEHFGVEE